MAETELLRELSTRIIGMLLDGELPTPTPISEASVHLPQRGTRWMAVFTGPGGGQTWKSTGLVSRHQALRLARQWEREARLQREKLGRTSRTVLRVRHSGGETGAGLTQQEVAQLLGISVRAVRDIEKRALRKLFNHSGLRELWKEFSSAQVKEDRLALTLPEIAALFSVAQNTTERRLILKLLRLTAKPEPGSLEVCAWDNPFSQP